MPASLDGASNAPPSPSYRNCACHHKPYGLDVECFEHCLTRICPNCGGGDEKHKLLLLLNGALMTDAQAAQIPLFPMAMMAWCRVCFLHVPVVVGGRS